MYGLIKLNSNYMIKKNRHDAARSMTNRFEYVMHMQTYHIGRHLGLNTGRRHCKVHARSSVLAHSEGLGNQANMTES